MASVVAGAVLACLLGIEDRRVYRFVLGGVGIGLCWLAAIGATLLYYHAVLPPREGTTEGCLGPGQNTSRPFADVRFLQENP